MTRDADDSAGVRQLTLVRHGESLGNVAAAQAHAAAAEEIAVAARDADVELSQLGERQAVTVGAALLDMPEGARPEILACSPYVRARQTAQLACEVAGLDLPLRVDERLRDRELGVLDRLTQDGVASRYPEEAQRRAWQGKFYHRPAGGESWADVVLRLRSWLSDLDRDLPGARVLVVSHDVVIVLLRYVCEGLDEAQVLDIAARTPMRNAAVSSLVRDEDGAWRTAVYDDVTHLRRAGLTVTEHQG
ncbi:MAG: Phosphoglycerate mutase, partial [Nocardioidaceae bacterium]|nr:Phosphoglycerate mutase [Nocardioidaceae bacterium]